MKAFDVQMKYSIPVSYSEQFQKAPQAKRAIINRKQ